LWPDGAWGERLIEAAAPVLAAAGGRALARVDLHVTLCFLGAVAEPELAALRERAAGIDAAAFELSFGRLELWREARILAATVERVPSAAAELAGALARTAAEVGITLERRPWRPHITLARGVKLLPAVAAGRLLPLALPAGRFYLAESQGVGAQACGNAEPARYATLASWPLRA
jgi:RNA 2',3'-cyclic 3'-phosphodiesterase